MVVFVFPFSFYFEGVYLIFNVILLHSNKLIFKARCFFEGCLIDVNKTRSNELNSFEIPFCSPFFVLHAVQYCCIIKVIVQRNNTSDMKHENAIRETRMQTSIAQLWMKLHIAPDFRTNKDI